MDELQLSCHRQWGLRKSISRRASGLVRAVIGATTLRVQPVAVASLPMVVACLGPSTELLSALAHQHPHWPPTPRVRLVPLRPCPRRRLVRRRILHRPMECTLSTHSVESCTVRWSACSRCQPISSSQSLEQRCGPSQGSRSEAYTWAVGPAWSPAGAWRGAWKRERAAGMDDLGLGDQQRPKTRRY